MTAITPSMRFEAICYYFGYQGGTIHQLNADTGVDVHAIPLDVAGVSVDDGGTDVKNSNERRRKHFWAPLFHGNADYWAGVINAYWANGPLGSPDFSERFGNGDKNV